MCLFHYSRYDQTADDWDDDWDDDDTYEALPAPPQNALTHSSSNYDSKNLPAAPHEADTVSMASNATTATHGTTTLKKSGMFGKSSDSYIFGLGNKEPLPENEIVHIMQVDNFYKWQTNSQNYSVVVTSPKKESKFKGMKTFIAYQLTPSFNNISVSKQN